MTINIGFIGPGIMGGPMALNLMKGGHKLWVHARRAEAMKKLVTEGATACASAAEVAKNADVIFLIVSDTPDVESVIFGEAGLAKLARSGSVIVDMSTISPTTTKVFAERLAKQSVDMLDAPVSGGETGAINGTLSIMVGGKTKVFERVKPLFELMGKNIVHVGDNGAIEAVAEALTFARKNGADPAKVRDALMGGFAGSKVMEVHGKRMLDNDFKPGFKVGLHQKDMRIVMETAHQLGVALPAAALVTQHLNALMGTGDKDLDSAAVVKVVKRMSGMGD